MTALSKKNLPGLSRFAPMPAYHRSQVDDDRPAVAAVRAPLMACFSRRSNSALRGTNTAGGAAVLELPHDMAAKESCAAGDEDRLRRPEIHGVHHCLLSAFGLRPPARFRDQRRGLAGRR